MKGEAKKILDTAQIPRDSEWAARGFETAVGEHKQKGAVKKHKVVWSQLNMNISGHTVEFHTQYCKDCHETKKVTGTIFDDESGEVYVRVFENHFYAE